MSALASAWTVMARSDEIPHHVERDLLAALTDDPPLLIYAALHQSTDAVSLESLAHWLAHDCLDQFAGGDVWLGVPSVDDALRARWSELRSYFKTLPLDRWMGEASPYLEATGPTVPVLWRSRWPQVTTDEAEEFDGRPTSSTRSSQPTQVLGQWARLALEHRSLASSFDRQLHRARLSSLKQLAYGLSHEINNPLANVSTRAQQLQRTEQDANRLAVLQRIVDQTYRAHEMIADLMFYANPPLPRPISCDLRSIIERVIENFADQAQRHTVKIQTKIPASPQIACVDDTMLGEALRALIRNAIEAIGCEGTVIVSLAATNCDWTLQVADSGPGLSEEARRHAFDPYFSGREAGRGLGLGLCRAYRIASLHRGDIHLAAAPAGCVATLTFPRESPSRTLPLS